MGIDALMYVRIADAPMSDRDVRRLSADLVEAFSTSDLFVIRPGDGQYPNGRHAIEPLEKDEYGHLDLGRLERAGADVSGQWLEVHLWGRYYGEGYERGPWPTYDGICEWLTRRLPTCQVWYAGDSGGAEMPEQMTREMRDRVWAHYAVNGHKPYAGAFNRGGKRHCDFCDMDMDHYGTGPNWAAHRCAGCGLNEESRDGGETWTPRKEEN